MNRKDSIKQQEQRGTRNRNKEIYRLYKGDKAKQVDIAWLFGLTKQRVNAIIKREKQLERNWFMRFFCFWG